MLRLPRRRPLLLLRIVLGATGASVPWTPFACGVRSPRCEAGAVEVEGRFGGSQMVSATRTAGGTTLLHQRGRVPGLESQISTSAGAEGDLDGADRERPWNEPPEMGSAAAVGDDDSSASFDFEAFRTVHRLATIRMLLLGVRPPAAAWADHSRQSQSRSDKQQPPTQDDLMLASLQQNYQIRQSLRDARRLKEEKRRQQRDAASAAVAPIDLLGTTGSLLRSKLSSPTSPLPDGGDGVSSSILPNVTIADIDGTTGSAADGEEVDPDAPVKLTSSLLARLVKELRGMQVPSSFPIERLAAALREADTAGRAPQTARQLARLFDVYSANADAALPVVTRQQQSLMRIRGTDMEWVPRREKGKLQLADVVSPDPDIERQLLLAMAQFKLWELGEDPLYRTDVVVDEDMGGRRRIDRGLEMAADTLRTILTEYAPGHQQAFRDFVELALVAERTDWLSEALKLASPAALLESANGLLEAQRDEEDEMERRQRAEASNVVVAAATGRGDGGGNLHRFDVAATAIKALSQQPSTTAEAARGTATAEEFADALAYHAAMAQRKYRHDDGAPSGRHRDTAAPLGFRPEDYVAASGAASHDQQDNSHAAMRLTDGESQRHTATAVVLRAASLNITGDDPIDIAKRMSFTLTNTVVRGAAEYVVHVGAKCCSEGGPGQGTGSKAVMAAMQLLLPVLDPEMAVRLAYTMYDEAERLVVAAGNPETRHEVVSAPEAMQQTATTMLKCLCTTGLSEKLDASGVLTHHCLGLLYVSLRQQGRLHESYTVVRDLIQHYDNRLSDILAAVRDGVAKSDDDRLKNVAAVEARFRMMFFQYINDRSLEDPVTVGEPLIVESIERYPQASEGWRLLALCMQRLGRTEDAAIAAVHAARLNPLDTSAHLIAATQLRKMERYDESAVHVLMSEKCDAAIKVFGPTVTMGQLAAAGVDHLLLPISPSDANAMIQPWKSEIDALGKASEARELFRNPEAHGIVLANQEHEGTGEHYEHDPLNTEYIQRLEASVRYSKFHYIAKRRGGDHAKDMPELTIGRRPAQNTAYQASSADLPETIYGRIDAEEDALREGTAARLSDIVQQLPPVTAQTPP